MYAWNLNGDKSIYLFDGVAPPPDTTPPIRSNGSPSGVLPQGTTQTTISLDTNEDATCRYATTPGVDYGSMAGIFDTSGGRTHSSLVTGLSDGATFSYYVRCEDAVGNQNPGDFLIEFTVSDQPGPSGLIAQWVFDEGFGTAAFDNVGTQQGTLTNMDPATDWVPGKIGTALDFDGTNDTVLVSDSSSLNLTEFTFAHWVKSTTPGGVGATRQTVSKGGQNYIFSWSHSSDLYDKACALFDATNTWRSSGSVSQQLDADTWYHIACVYDGTDLIAYVNGVEGAWATINQTPTTNNGLLSIGSGVNLNGSGASFFSGVIDDVRVYNRALSEAEINFIFGEVAPPPDTTPPIRLTGSPSGVLPQGTTQTTISLDTNEDATCRYATTPGVDYGSMAGIFDTSGGRTHSSLVTGLSDGATFSYYVRCEDAVGNQNPGDFLIEFTVSDQPGPSGLIAQWVFDEGFGTAAFDNVGTQQGTLTNMDPATDWVPGKIGTALDFDGTNDTVLVSDSSSLNLTEFTFAHWVKSTTPGGVGATRQTVSKGGQNYIFSWSHSSDLYDKACALFDATNTWRSSGSVSQQLDADTWYHIACVYDGTDLIAYVNGVEGAWATINQTPTTNNGSLSIGSGVNLNGSGASFFSGVIDDVRVYNRALSEAEINFIFGEVAPPPDTTPPIRLNGSPSGVLPQGTTQTTISLDTNEDATCRYATTPGVDYGSMAGIFDTSGGRTHSSLVTGLSDGATFSYYVRCEDAVGNQNPGDFLIEFTVSDQSSTPVIDVWYGSPQLFGQLGVPQQWVNILGNVTDPDGIATLTYALNGGTDSTLSTGPDSRRLADEGDFNVEIDHTDLVDGPNSVVIKATDNLGFTTTETVTVNYTSGNAWPLPYSVDWDTVIDVQDVAQIVDGKWALVPGACVQRRLTMTGCWTSAI